ALAAWRKPDPKDRLLNLWRPLPDRPANDAVAAIGPAVPALLKDPRPGIQEMAAKLTARLSLATAGKSLAELAINEKAASGARMAALQALSSLKDSRLPEAAKAGMSARDPRVRSEALKALAGQDPAAAIEVIAEIIETGTQIEKQGALMALREMKQPE
ncbi:MAG: hypothetical protein M3463_02665, partial [Verrucomicrobiota bacterium]|nr:hypothetical protein [Verrucomicrobiota bacterium]